MSARIALEPISSDRTAAARYRGELRRPDIAADLARPAAPIQLPSEVAAGPAGPPAPSPQAAFTVAVLMGEQPLLPASEYAAQASSLGGSDLPAHGSLSLADIVA